MIPQLSPLKTHRQPRFWRFNAALVPLLLVAFIGTGLIPKSAEGYYVARYKAREMLRKDCRDIRRVARFYISTSCRFKLLSVRSLDIATPDFALEREIREQERRSRSGIGLEVRKDFFENELRDARKQRDKRVAAQRNLQLFEAKPQSLLMMVVRTKGIMSKFVFTIVYRIRWKNTTDFERTVIKVEKQRNLDTEALQQNIIDELREEEREFQGALERPATASDDNFLPGTREKFIPLDY